MIVRSGVIDSCPFGSKEKSSPFQNCLWTHRIKMQLNKSRRRRVYHQFRKELHIIKAERFVYHHCERKYSLRLMIYTFGDEIHAKA